MELPALAHEGSTDAIVRRLNKNKNENILGILISFAGQINTHSSRKSGKLEAGLKPEENRHFYPRGPGVCYLERTGGITGPAVII